MKSRICHPPFDADGSARATAENDLCMMFNALRWIVRPGAPWRSMPQEFPPWEAVYQQTQRWLPAGCIEAMVRDLRSVLRTAQGKQGQPVAVILDGRTLQSTCERDPRAGYDGYKRKKGSKVHMAGDTLVRLPAMQVTPANEQQRVQVRPLAREIQHGTGETVTLALAGQGYTGRSPQKRPRKKALPCMS